MHCRKQVRRHSSSQDYAPTHSNSNAAPPLLWTDESKDFLQASPRIRRGVTVRKERTWDYGVIPYEIDSIFSGAHKALFKQAMRYWENFTCIKFVERDAKLHTNYIYFTIKSCG